MIPLIILAIESPSDREFMANLYVSYNRLMYSEINKILKDPWETEDVLQTALVKLIDKIALLQTLNRSKRINYIISTCKNTAYSYARIANRVSEFEYLDFDGVSYDDNPLENQVIMNETLDHFKTAWDALDERSRYFLESKYILDKNDEEIARDMNIKSSSVRMNLTRARNKLKVILKEME